jgi:hypothetical protein
MVRKDFDWLADIAGSWRKKMDSGQFDPALWKII